jgi:hypothetical protein
MVQVLLHGILVMASTAATTWPSMEKFVWNFNLVRVASTTSTLDTFTIQFDAANRLVFPDVMKIRLYAGDASEPMYARDWAGNEGGLNGLLYMPSDWHIPLAGLTGRLELEMLAGSVDLHRVSLSIQDGTSRYTDSITPDIQLVPEPGIGAWALAITGLLLRRKRDGGSPAWSAPAQSEDP